MAQRKSQKQIFVIGLGVKIPAHTTVEAFEAMSQCERIYSIVQQPPELWLPSGRAIPVINLLTIYQDGAPRSQNYENAATTVLNGLSEVDAIGYVTYGNPLVYDSVAQKLIEDGRAAGIVVSVIPGISSIDTILCDLGRDMAPGVQIYEASWLVLSRCKLNVSLAAILLQIGHFGSLRAHYRQPREGSALAGLSLYLQKFYPGTHPVLLVQSSSGSHPALAKGVKLNDLKALKGEDFAESLYIPPLESVKLNRKLLSKMQQPA